MIIAKPLRLGMDESEVGIGRDAPYRGIRKGKHPFQRTFPNFPSGF